MRKKVEAMPSLEVILQRLPEAVIAALEGPIVKQDLASLQSLPALDMKTVAMLLRRKIPSPMPLSEVVLERLPQSMMTKLISQKNCYPVMPLSDIITPTKSLLPMKISGQTARTQNVVLKDMLRLEVALERLPEAITNTLLSRRRSMLLAKKGKNNVGRPKKTRLDCKPNFRKVTFLV
ncbi:unnamed protein product, partial [Iphiclides podalirius]